MKYPAKLSVALHALCLIHIFRDYPEAVNSKEIAHCTGTNPSYIRQLMMPLVQADIVIPGRGRISPKLKLEPEKITVASVYKAIENDRKLLNITTGSNPNCRIGTKIQAAIGEKYDIVQKKAIEEMERITLADILSDFESRVNEEDYADTFRKRRLCPPDGKC